MAVTASPVTGVPNNVACPVVQSIVVSCCAPNNGPHMLYRSPHFDMAREAQPSAPVGPMSVVVTLFSLTVIARTSAPALKRAGTSRSMVLRTA
jgi:hypothetical protein